MEVDIMLKFGHEDIKRLLEHLIETTQSQQKPKSTEDLRDEVLAKLQKAVDEVRNGKRI